MKVSTLQKDRRNEQNSLDNSETYKSVYMKYVKSLQVLLEKLKS